MQTRYQTQASLVTMLQVIVAIVLILVFLGVSLWKNRKLLQISRQLRNSIKSYPLLGISYLFFGDSEDHMNAIQKIGQETIKQGGITAAWFGIHLYISIADPVIAEIVLKTCLEKDDLTRFTRLASGNGIIFAPVSIWRPRRKILAPSFNIRNLSRFVPSFANQGKIMLDQIKCKLDTETGPLSMFPFLYTNSVDSICETTLGVQLNAQKNPENAFMKAMAECIHLIAERTCQPWLHSDVVYKRLPSYKKLRSFMDFAKNFVDDVIKTKRKQMEKFHESVQSEVAHRSLLEILLHQGQDLSNLELREEMLTFLVAGTDTSAVGVGFVMLMLARHPAVQEKVFQELKDTVGESTRPITSEDIPKLKYLNLVIKETLRLYPPGVVLLRKIDKDVTLPSGLTLPNGCGATINIFAIQRNPAYWGADAEQFRPERFLDTPLKHPAQFMPFSFGSRNCIGYQYAMLSMKTAITTLLQSYHVLPAVTNSDGTLPPLRLKFDFMLKDADDFRVLLLKRE